MYYDQDSKKREEFQPLPLYLPLYDDYTYYMPQPEEAEKTAPERGVWEEDI